ncbi:MAG: ribosome recycling factor [Candidatus Lindowbacteria bacterium RIFCSPLOWO2_12_FULL_62_27]|nr:MAG: ribosome recycling factor [Candidatus Lindowbacteria bacterium RIFCSPLOWO2_12_FULL_62_27]OGH63699.1 MAG: ribosome recycling factor [Candidatus Lindowbacteria bacterium RIFCSPLOWO2_02_FULL_62_12]
MIQESFFKDCGASMDKVCDVFQTDLSGFRTGRASTKILEDLPVDAYGSTMRMKELGSISVPEPNLLVVQPWDRSVTQAIEKSIRTSDLNLSPVVEGGLIRVRIPPLSEERRKELSKVISKKGEEARVSIRAVRHEAVNEAQEMRKKGEAAEDEEKRAKDRIQKLTDAAIRKIDDATNKKIEEIQKV